jgi:lysophospholipase
MGDADDSFVLGTSSTLFSGALLQLKDAQASGISGVALTAVQSILEGISSDDNDIAQVRNSFKGYNTDNNPVSSSHKPETEGPC